VVELKTVLFYCVILAIQEPVGQLYDGKYGRRRYLPGFTSV